MAATIFYVFEVAIKEGHLDDFRVLMNEMVESTWAHEPHTLGYEWYISADGRTCHTCERYAGSDAVVTHMKRVQERYSQRYFEAAEPRRLVVCGEPNEEVKAIFAPLSPVYLAAAAGFTR